MSDHSKIQQRRSLLALNSDIGILEEMLHHSYAESHTKKALEGVRVKFAGAADYGGCLWP